MLSSTSVFDALSLSKIVFKEKQIIRTKKSQLLQSGYLFLTINNKTKASKKCFMVLTHSGLYYSRTDIKTIDDEVVIETKARIELSWLRSLFYTKKTSQGEPNTYYFEIVKNNKSVVFNCLDYEEYTKWVVKISMLTIQTNFAKKYQVSRELGQGGSAKVYEAIDTHTKKAFACKQFKKEKLKSLTELESLMNEISILRILNGHPNIVNLIETQETENSIYIITELLEGGRITQRGEKYTPNEIKFIAKAVLDAIIHMNNNFIVHRDLKPGNILLKYNNKSILDNEIKVIDFGIATFYNEENQQYKSCGTVGYLAPETINKTTDIKVSPVSDIFTVGVILYNALTGIRLFIQLDEQSSVIANRKAEINFYHSGIRKSPSACKLISEIITQRHAKTNP